MPNLFRLIRKILLAVITIKYNYPYENENLINNFAKDFNQDKRIEIKSGSSKDKYAVFDSGKTIFIFSLNNTDTLVFSNFWGITGFSLSIIFLGDFLFSFMPTVQNWFGRNQLNIRTFFVISVSVGIITGLSLYFNLPSIFYWNKIFSSFSNIHPIHFWLQSVTSQLPLYSFWLPITYSSTRRLKVQKVIGEKWLYKYFLHFTFYWFSIFWAPIFVSSIQLNILQFKDITFVSLWLHLLLFLWGVGMVLLFLQNSQLD